MYCSEGFHKLWSGPPQTFSEISPCCRPCSPPHTYPAYVGRLDPPLKIIPPIYTRNADTDRLRSLVQGSVCYVMIVAMAS